MASNLRTFFILSHKAQVLRNVACPVVNTVRFRKPRWLPPAKSKEFYVREPTPIDPIEHAELEQRYKHYRASMRGIRAFLKEHLAVDQVDQVQQQIKDDDADFAWMSEELSKWNQRVAANRELRQAEEERQEKERIERRMQEQAELRLQKAMQAEQSLQASKEASANFISKERLDDEIEKMLDSRSDYNFAITKSGDILQGEVPDKKQNQDSVASS